MFKKIILLLNRLSFLESRPKKIDIHEKIEKEKNDLMASLSSETFKDASANNRCILSGYCTHYFALCHDLKEYKPNEIFLCWDLPNCLCITKKREGCDECFRKKEKTSLCWAIVKQRKNPWFENQ